MEENTKKLINIILQQAEIFLLDAGEFFPFCSCLDKSNNIIPVIANIKDKNDRPASSDVISLLERGIKERLASEEYILGAIGVDVTGNRNGVTFDAIEIRIFYAYKNNVDKIYYKYNIRENKVDFSS